MLDGDQIVGMIVDVEKEFGLVDIFVNNVGIQYVLLVEEFLVVKWDVIIVINLFFVFYVIWVVVLGMKSWGWGWIINIVFVYVLVVLFYKFVYVVVKYGIVGLIKIVVLEVVEQGIIVNVICLGYVWMLLVEVQILDIMKVRGMIEDEVKKDVFLKVQLIKKFVSIEQVVGYVVFLCFDIVFFIIGFVLLIDGGWIVQ